MSINLKTDRTPDAPPGAKSSLKNPSAADAISPVQDDISSLTVPSENAIWLTLEGYLRPRELKLERIEREEGELAMDLFEAVAAMYEARHCSASPVTLHDVPAGSPREQIQRLISVQRSTGERDD